MLRAIFFMFLACLAVALGWWLWAGRPDIHTIWDLRPSFIKPADEMVLPHEIDPARPVARPVKTTPEPPPAVVEDLPDPLDRAISAQIYRAETAFSERQRRERLAAARDDLRRELKRDALDRAKLIAVAQRLGADAQMLDDITKTPTTQDGRDRLVRLLETLL